MGWRDRMLDAMAPTRALSPDDRAAVDDARRALNLDRAAIAIPVMAVYDALAIWFLRPRGEGVERLWRERVCTAYVAMLGAMVLLGVVVLLLRSPRARRWVGELTSASVLAGAAALTDASHLVGFSMTPYLIAIALILVTFRTRLLFATVLHVTVLAAMWTSIFTSSLDAIAQQRNALNALVVALFGVVLSRSLERGLVRETVARRALEGLNASLESRVAAQVAEITARAREVEALNHSLRERVRDRSHELGVALARLAASELGQRAQPAGSVLADRYELQRPIGVGGMGVVYAARDRATGDSVAVKLVRAAERVEALQRFLIEARATATIDHPAIVRVLHVDVSPDGELFQVLELLDGRSLELALAELGRLSPAAVVRLGELVAAGIAAAHERGVIHRDIKPANIMLTSVAPGVKILDFGLAKLRRQPDVVATEGGVVLGTAGFLAPEQIETPDRVDGAADIYALGATLYQCLAGQPPFRGEHAMKLLHRQLHEAPPDLAERAPAAPAELVALIMSSLARDPAARPSAADVAARLGAMAEADGLPPWDGLSELGGSEPTRRLRAAVDMQGPTEDHVVGRRG